MNYDKELDICKDATPGPWGRDYDNADDGGGQWEIAGPAKIHYPYRADEKQPKADADYIATFHPQRVMELLEAERQRDELKEALSDAMGEYSIPMSDYYKGLLK